MSARDRSWLGMVLAPAAWAVQEWLSYAVAAQACTAAHPEAGGFGPAGARITIAAITIVCIAAALWGGLAGWSAWRVRATNGTAEGYTRPDFVALASAVTGLLLAIGILYGGLPLIFVDPCMRMR